MKKTILFIFFLLISIVSKGQANLIADINQGNISSSPSNKIVFKDFVYFTANDGINGLELWRTDGTESGTELFKDLFVGSESGVQSFSFNAYATDNLLYFTAFENSDVYLWKTDGTSAGTEKIRQFSSFQNVHDVINGELIFSANQQLWKTDGTTNGTTFLDLTPVFGNRFTKVGNELFYAARQNNFQGVELWKTDGTSAGTAIVKDIYTSSNQSSFPNNFSVLNNEVYFSATNGTNGFELWKSDGSSDGTILVKDISQGSSNTNFGSESFVNFNNELFFLSGNEMWKTNGTAEGTVFVKDLESSVKLIISFNNKLYAFNRNNSFWVSDGTTTNTEKLEIDIFEFFHNNSYALVGNQLFFQGFNQYGYEIWKTDGTVAGTVLLKDIQPGGNDDGNIQDIVAYKNRAIFTANDSNNLGSELYISDGTTSGTNLLKDINKTGNNASTPQQFFTFNNSVLFSADNATEGRELWVFDGVNATLLKDINEGLGYANPRNFTELNGEVYFYATTLNAGTELWKTDGTELGTILVKDINPGLANGLGLGNIVTANNKLYFFANDGGTGYELWESDGTETGTKLVKDINVGESQSPRSGELITYNNEVYFSAHTGDNDYELWKSDGTEEGTILHHHYNFSGSSNPANFTLFEGFLYYSSKDDLIRTDGTTATKISNTDPSNLTVVGDKLFFTAGFSDGGELWACTGATAYKVKEIRSGSSGSFPSNLTAHKQELYFVANDGNIGNELWKSDGTDAGTVLVKDIRSGSSSSSIQEMVSFNEVLLFSGGENSGNRELWITDGTSEGTKVFQEINPSAEQFSNGSSPQSFHLFNNDLIFAANNGTSGIELWFLQQQALSVEKTNLLDELSIHIFPNPTIKILNFSIGNETITEVVFFDITGKKVAAAKNKESTENYKLDISNLKKGIYLVKINTKKTSYQSKVIKN